MNFLIFKGDDIIETAHNLSGAKIAAKRYLPKGFKKGDDLRPSLCITIFKQIYRYGDKYEN